MDEKQRLRNNRERILQHLDIDWLIWIAIWIVDFPIINFVSLEIGALKRHIRFLHMHLNLGKWAIFSLHIHQLLHSI